MSAIELQNLRFYELVQNYIVFKTIEGNPNNPNPNERTEALKLLYI